MCESCLRLLETVLANRSIMAGTWGDRSEQQYERVDRLGQPLTIAQKLVWVNRWLPLTAAAMDLNGVIAAAEREPAQRP
jgi:hypothetical protein